MEGAAAMKHTALELQAISFSYSDSSGTQKRLFQNFSMTVSKGERLCLYGPSGIGKSTLLRLMMELETPDSGRIFYPEKLKKAVVFQEDRLLPFTTVLRNLTLFGSLSDARRHLAALDLCEYENVRPSALSGGMKRRAAIARALTADGDILFLDEPFSGLDRETLARTAAHIVECSRGKTIVMVSHSKDEARLLNAELFYL